MARPKKPIDPAAVEKLAGMGFSAELIADYLDVSHYTLERRFAPILKRGRGKRNGRLMAKLYQEAMATPCNTAVLIFLAKNFLGMTDKPDVVVNVQQNAIGCQVPLETLVEDARLAAEVALQRPPGLLPDTRSQEAS